MLPVGLLYTAFIMLLPVGWLYTAFIMLKPEMQADEENWWKYLKASTWHESSVSGKNTSVENSDFLKLKDLFVAMKATFLANKQSTE